MEARQVSVIRALWTIDFGVPTVTLIFGVRLVGDPLMRCWVILPWENQVAMVLDPNNPNDWDAKRLEFERYKLRLEYKKFLWGSVVAAIAIAAIPPAFQAGTALIEYVKSMAQLQNDQLVFRQRHISDFVARAVDRDIEPRIRLAEYFASVSGKEFREGWREYWVELQKQRDKNWQLLDDLEERWVKMPSPYLPEL